MSSKSFYTVFIECFYVGMPERPNGQPLSGCGFCLRGFESSSPHKIYKSEGFPNTMTNKKEKIVNVPNFITLWRVPLTILAIYYLLFSGDRFLAALFLAFAGITDFLDGQFARGLDQVTELGAKFDIVADRIFIILFGFALIFFFKNSPVEMLLLFLCLSREAISFPAFIYRRIKRIPLFSDAKFIGKLQTTIQAAALVFLTWGVSWSIYVIGLSFITGIFAGLVYWKDSVHAA